MRTKRNRNRNWERRGLGGGGVLQISIDGEVQRIFLGLKYTILGFFMVGIFWQVFLQVVCKNDH